jgi:type IV pilus biogenesis protein CpaD/CtpE
MAYLKAIAGALAIMAASGMIADFDLTEKDREIHVQVWSAGDQTDADLRKDVAVLLTRYVVDDKRIVVTENKA